MRGGGRGDEGEKGEGIVERSGERRRERKKRGKGERKRMKVEEEEAKRSGVRMEW